MAAKVLSEKNATYKKNATEVVQQWAEWKQAYVGNSKDSVKTEKKEKVCG